MKGFFWWGAAVEGSVSRQLLGFQILAKLNDCNCPFPHTDDFQVIGPTLFLMLGPCPEPSASPDQLARPWERIGVQAETDHSQHHPYNPSVIPIIVNGNGSRC